MRHDPHTCMHKRLPTQIQIMLYMLCLSRIMALPLGTILSLPFRLGLHILDDIKESYLVKYDNFILACLLPLCCGSSQILGRLVLMIFPGNNNCLRWWHYSVTLLGQTWYSLRWDNDENITYVEALVWINFGDTQNAGGSIKLLDYFLLTI